MKEMLDVLTEYGEFTGTVASREECHKNGYWHRAVYGFIIDRNLNVLLQKRSLNKKLWPGKWDVTVGGHVESGEFGLQTIIRECKEELGITIDLSNIELILSFKRKFDFVDVWLVKQDIDISNIVLQEEEVSEVKWSSIDEIRELMKTDKLAKSIEIYFDMFINLINYPF